MFTFDNTHIFTGYLKQLLSSFPLPTCKVYTREFARHLELTGQEDPRIVESFNIIKKENSTTAHPAVRVNYLKDGSIYNYFWDYTGSGDINAANTGWTRTSKTIFETNTDVKGLTKTLNSPGSLYDTHTHEYLGDYLRFMRDYYGVNLMSLYNCFNNKIYTNIYNKIPAETKSVIQADGSTKKIVVTPEIEINTHDSKYRIYAFPVKLFEDYTIAIDSNQSIEMFCGLYKTSLDLSEKATNLIRRTYKKFQKTLFKQPFLYDCLNVKYWNKDIEIDSSTAIPPLLDSSKISRCDILDREQDLKLFIKVPINCHSSIVVLEGDFRHFNDFKYAPKITEKANKNVTFEYTSNSAIINFAKDANIETADFKPIGKLQLLAFNTGESYPFATRLVEYLSESAITPITEITDNIKRVQKVMAENKHNFRIEGLWENKMQKIIYDYMVNAGPIDIAPGKTPSATKIVDHRCGYHPKLGYNKKSTKYDLLGYVDKDAEKYYASWKLSTDKQKAIPADTIQNVDIYDGLYDI